MMKALARSMSQKGSKKPNPVKRFPSVSFPKDAYPKHLQHR